VCWKDDDDDPKDASTPSTTTTILIIRDPENNTNKNNHLLSRKRSKGGNFRGSMADTRDGFLMSLVTFPRVWRQAFWWGGNVEETIKVGTNVLEAGVTWQAAPFFPCRL